MHVIAPMIYIPIVQHLAFLASVAVFWPGSDFSAETSHLVFMTISAKLEQLWAAPPMITH